MKSSICINIDDTNTVASSFLGGNSAVNDRAQHYQCSVDGTGMAGPTDQLRALSLNRLDGVLRSTGSAEMPFKCPSYPRLGDRDRQLSGSTALDELSMSPRHGSNVNLSQDLDASDLLPVGSVTDVAVRPLGVALNRSVSVRTAAAASRPFVVSVQPLAPASATGTRKSSRRQTELTSEQQLPFPDYPAVVGVTVRRSMSCPTAITCFGKDVDRQMLAVSNTNKAAAANRRLLAAEAGGTGARGRRRRSSAFERDVDLHGEVVNDLPVAVRDQFPDFEPETPNISAASPQPPLHPRVTDPKPPVDPSAPTADSRPAAAGHRFAVNDSRLLLPTCPLDRHMISGSYTPPVRRCDIEIKCLRWLRDTERQ